MLSVARLIEFIVEFVIGDSVKFMNVVMHISPFMDKLAVPDECQEG